MNGKPRIILAVMLLATWAGSLPAQNPIAPSSAQSRTVAPPTEITSTPPTTPAEGALLATASAVSASGDYVLSPSDTVEMTVFHEPDLATKSRIASDGSVQFPLIGELKIGGLAIRDARVLIRKRYNADYLVEPQVYLNIIEYAQRKFTILGQVAKPGTYAIPGGERFSLLEAVGVAGGFTRIADRASVIIKRTDHGSEQMLKLNAKNVTQKDGKKFELMPGDVITVGESWF